MRMLLASEENLFKETPDAGSCCFLLRRIFEKWMLGPHRALIFHGMKSLFPLIPNCLGLTPPWRQCVLMIDHHSRESVTVRCEIQIIQNFEPLFPTLACFFPNFLIADDREMRLFLHHSSAFILSFPRWQFRRTVFYRGISVLTPSFSVFL